MARNLFMAGAGVLIGLVLGAAIQSHAEPDETTTALAAEAGVSAEDVEAAVQTVLDAGIPTDARQYLAAAGLLAAPPTPAPRGNYSARVACIESKESGGANVANRHGSGAVGVLQYMPSTFAPHALEMGHPEWSPWIPWQARAVAEHDLALGRRAQWAVGGC